MPITQSELQVTWDAGSSSDLLNTGNSWEATSDNMSFASTLFKAEIQVKAEQTSGTPASGDTIDFYAQVTLGDPDGAGADEYDTDGHDIFLGQIDLNTDSPGIQTVLCPAGKGIRIRAVGSGLAGGDVATISATILQHLA